MFARFCTKLASVPAELPNRLVNATAALVSARNFEVDELRASQHDAVIAVTFALSSLPRRVVEDGLGEVFFNEDTAITDRGGCDGIWLR